MSRKYREEELQDTIVLDSGGYICGYVSGLDVRDGSVVLNLYGFEVKNQDTIDEKGLILRLKEAVPRKGIFNHKLSTDELRDWIRNQLNLSNKEPINIEHLMKYAGLVNIVIPKEIKEMRVKVERGFIEWASIDKIAFSDLGKCIILNDSVEAKKRGIVPSDIVKFVSTEQLSGKIVIDSQGKIIGSAVRLMPGYPPGIAINFEQTNELETSSLARDLEKTKNSKNEIQNKAVVSGETTKEVVINWNKIAKIGDAVFLKVTLKVVERERQPKKLQSTQIELSKAAMPDSSSEAIEEKKAVKEVEFNLNLPPDLASTIWSP
ncbi:MAG: hypothetical protein QG670_548 [Thermoproteota archaeon]|nr:hypothetical protein [Thermoproteota archaeon]